MTHRGTSGSVTKQTHVLNGAELCVRGSKRYLCLPGMINRKAVKDLFCFCFSVFILEFVQMYILALRRLCEFSSRAPSERSAAAAVCAPGCAFWSHCGAVLCG